jgi:hypothetical protein
MNLNEIDQTKMLNRMIYHLIFMIYRAIFYHKLFGFMVYYLACTILGFQNFKFYLNKNHSSAEADQTNF